MLGFAHALPIPTELMRNKKLSDKIATLKKQLLKYLRCDPLDPPN